MFMAGYLSNSLLFSDWRKMGCLLVCHNQWRIQDFVNGCVNNRCSAANLLITVRKRSCGNVMFSQACVKNSVHRGKEVYTAPGRHPPARQTPPPRGKYPLADPIRQPPPRRRPLQRRVRILLECILVGKIVSKNSMKSRKYSRRMRSQPYVFPNEQVFKNMSVGGGEGGYVPVQWGRSWTILNIPGWDPKHHE